MGSIGRSKNEASVCYAYGGGVDFTGEHKSDHKRPVYMENLYRDYEGSGADMLESIPGFRILTSSEGKINGIYKSDLGLVIHSGTSLILADMTDGEVTEKRVIGTLNDGRSRAFSVNKNVYVLDGESISCIDGTKTAYKIGENGKNAYIPTTYFNGVAYEQRNLLTDKFEEKFLIPSGDDYRLSADGLYFRVTDFDEKKCAVTGTNETFFGNYVSIPSFTTIGGERYSVTSIDDGAFKPGTVIKELHIGEGIGVIGKSAFAGCTAIEKIFFPKSLSEIGDGAFAGCSALTTIYVWLGLERIGDGAFERCSSLSEVYYTGTENDFKKITNYSGLLDKAIMLHSGYYGIKLELPLTKAAKTVEHVKVGETKYAFTTVTEKGLIKSVIISVHDKRILVGKTASITGTYADVDEEMSRALRSCTVYELYDGRVFLSGSESMPGKVFYSGINEDGSPNVQYFGEYDTFKDGYGEASIVAMLCAHDGLIVFCNADSGGGIFYHTRVQTDDDFIPTVYPVSYIHSGITAKADAISFYDDPVFLTDAGVYGVDMKRLDCDRSVSCRSTLINPNLLTEPLDDAYIAKWRGYLAVAVGEHIYLADSRGAYTGRLGTREYEWYYLSGIGTRVGALSVYRYSSVAKEGFDVHPDCDSEVTDEVVMSVFSDGEQYCYVSLDGKRYAVHKTEEIKGGVFHPLCALHVSREDELFFGTTSGDVCVFNTDKRGVAPDFIRSCEGFSDEEYKSVFARKIHPYFYSFAGVAPTYVLKTAKDNCTDSSVLKNTVKHSLTLTCKTFAGRTLCEVGTDKRGYQESWHLPNAAVDFSYLDFGSLSFSTLERVTAPISEKEKGWIEKQITVYSNDFASPIGISEISYRFTVKGRIKKT